MLPLIPLIMSLVGSKKKEDAARQENEVAALQGQPTHAAPKSDLLGTLGGAMGGMLGGGGAAGLQSSLGSPEFDDPTAGAGGLSKGTGNFLDNKFGHGKDDEDLLA